VGATVELEYVSSPDNTLVDLNVAPEFVKLVRTSVLHRRKSGGWVPDVTMPFFYTMKPTTAITIAEDVPTLFTIMTPADEEGKADRTRKILLFVTARR
jgi:hypothetical protein